MQSCRQRSPPGQRYCGRDPVLVRRPSSGISSRRRDRVSPERLDNVPGSPAPSGVGSAELSDFGRLNRPPANGPRTPVTIPSRVQGRCCIIPLAVGGRESLVAVLWRLAEPTWRRRGLRFPVAFHRNACYLGGYCKNVGWLGRRSENLPLSVKLRSQEPNSVLNAVLYSA